MPLIGNTPKSFYAGLRINQEHVDVLPPEPGIPTPNFPNGNFEQDFAFWDVYKQHVTPGNIVPGALNTALGCPIPPDPTPYPVGRNNAGIPFTSYGQSPDLIIDSFKRNFESAIGTSPAGKFAILRSGKGLTSYPFGGTVYGPMLVSKNPVIAEVGDRVTLQWKATANGDAYNVFAYLLNKETCQHIVLIDATGEAEFSETPWFTVNRVIGPGEAANYYFVFICGSFDYTAGGLLGSELYIDEVTLQKAGTY